ncbi:MAG: hypothetical protein ACMXYC_05055, partial [Candidatus Woesearchaeota archaeon]
MERATIILFGSTGDLTKRKLIPALYHLFSKGKLSKDSAIVCLGRRVMTKAEYIDFLELPHFISNINKEIMDDFLSLVYYEHISYEQPDAQRIQQSLQAIEQAKTPNRILYVATPPDLFVPIVRVIE